MIENLEKFNQFVSYDGIEHKGARLTDIDGLMEYKNKAFIVIELKAKGTQLKAGQSLALQRLVEALARQRVTLYILAEHNEADVSKDIELSECAVRKYWFKDAWRTTGETVGQIVERYLTAIDTAYGIV